MTSATTPKRYATQTFTDAGTGQTFEAGQEVTGSPGEIANYEAAGLAGEKAEAKAAEPKTDGGKPA